MSESFAILNELLKSQNTPEDILVTVYDFDRVLGLRLNEFVSKDMEYSQEVLDILEERKRARESKDFSESDRLRDLLLEKGYKVLDTSNGQVLEKRY